MFVIAQADFDADSRNFIVNGIQSLEETSMERFDVSFEELDFSRKERLLRYLADLSQIYAGIGGAVSANNAEMEVVKTGQGNWAEHLWVKQQLRTARIHQGDGTDAIAHNYKLYQKYEEDLN